MIERVDELHRMEIPAWREPEAWVDDLRRYVESEAVYYTTVAPRAVVFVPSSAAHAIGVDRRSVYVSPGAIIAAREDGLEIGKVDRPCPLRDLPDGLELAIGHNTDAAVYLTRRTGDAHGVPDEDEGAPDVSLRPKPPLPPELYVRVELLLTLLYDTLMLVGAFLVRSGALWFTRRFAAPEHRDWALSAAEWLFDVGLVGTVSIHVVFDWAKRVRNAWRDLWG